MLHASMYVIGTGMKTHVLHSVAWVDRCSKVGFYVYGCIGRDELTRSITFHFIVNLWHNILVFWFASFNLCSPISAALDFYPGGVVGSKTLNEPTLRLVVTRSRILSCRLITMPFHFDSPSCSTFTNTSPHLHQHLSYFLTPLYCPRFSEIVSHLGVCKSAYAPTPHYINKTPLPLPTTTPRKG
jgi:hypothetical protein